MMGALSIAAKRRRRWSDDNRHFGPFTLSKDANSGRLGFVLDSGGSHESSSNKGCHLRLHTAGWTLIVELPRLLPDYRIRHIAKTWDAATVERMGRNWYDEVFPREFGAVAVDDTLHLYFGPQTHDSTTTKIKVLWIPWRNWRFIRKSWYGLQGEHLRTDWEGGPKEIKFARWESQREFEATMPKARFEIRDHDGATITAETHIEEREWRLGTGLFRWLSWFVKPRIRRSLGIEFAAEVGPEKGSWKGGLIGTGIDMLPGELHEQAFRRYCEQEHRAKYGRYRVEFVRALEGQTQ